MKEKQKFKIGYRVHIYKDMPIQMAHYKKDFDAIIEGSYAQLYNASSEHHFNTYSVIQLNKEGEPINSISWYPDSLMTLISDDIEAGKKLIEKYRFLGLT